MRPTSLAVAVLLVPALAPAADPVDYAKHVRPVLQERCFACHGVLQQKGKLRLDGAANLLKGGTTGPVVVPGKPADSDLIARVSAKDEAERMPPEGHPLKPAEIAALRAWVEQGAKVPSADPPEPDPRDHWAFRTPVRPPVPANSGRQPAGGVNNPIDAFVLAKLGEKGLQPVGPADRRVLLRRVYLDLIGLPPTPEQTDAFLKDTSPGAFEKVVDQLLASPQYGERWGRHFLDIWRYSDWWGLGAELRNSQKHIWHWRDWTIESLNADLGYDEMLRQMLAADELYPTDPQKLRATGYLARPYFLFNRTSWLDEVIEHTGKGMLGLTANCSKCHDHKYDPVTQLDYYRLRAVFEPYQVRTDMVNGVVDFEKAGMPRAFDANPKAVTPFHVRGDERNTDKGREVLPGLPGFLAPGGLKVEPVKLPREAYLPGSRADVIAAHEKAAAGKLADAQKAFGPARGLTAVVPVAAVWKRLDAAEKGLAAARAEAAAVAKAKADPTNPAVALKGAIKSRESNLDTTAAKTAAFPDTSTGRRTAFAKWLTDPANPLTARVVVNHVWSRHVGRPLVPTVFDFGRKGTPPSHPELLDWLACELMAPASPGMASRPGHGAGGADNPTADTVGSPRPWRLKHLHRLIVTSATYQRSSSALGADAAAAADPENRYLWRMNPVRMEAQVVRDSLLSLAGELDLTPGGPPVPLAAQDASRRRSLYFFHSHNEHNKLLGIFDDANVLDCYRRTESIVPQQALALSNSKFALSMAEKIAARLPAADDAAFVGAAFGLLLGNAPNADERAACVEALAEFREAATDLPEAARTVRARVQLVQALLNHNDFVTMR